MKKYFGLMLAAILCVMLAVCASAADTVYVNDGGTGDGTSAASPLGDLYSAIEKIADNGGKIVIVDTYTCTDVFTEPAHTGDIVITGGTWVWDTGTAKKPYNRYYLAGPGKTTFEEMTFSAVTASKGLVIVGGFNPLVMGVGMTTPAKTYVVGGYQDSLPTGASLELDSYITIKSGTYNVVCGSSRIVAEDHGGTSHILIEGGTIKTLQGGNCNYGNSGNAELTIKDGTITELQTAGDDTHKTCRLNGDCTVNLLGGTITKLTITKVLGTTTLNCAGGSIGTVNTTWGTLSDNPDTSKANSVLNVIADASDATIETIQTALEAGDRPYTVHLPAAFSFASVTLENDLALNFFAEEAQFDGCDNIRVSFTVDGEEIEVSDYTARTLSDKDYRAYRYEGINATQMGKDVTAQIKLSRNGTELLGTAVTYSVKDYATNMLAATDDAALKTLLVDLLNYGASAQTYCDADAGNLVNKDLTAEQQGYATQDDPELASVKAVSDVGDKPITAEAVSLTVGSHVEINYYFKCEDGYNVAADDLCLKVTYAGHTEKLDGSAFVKGEDGGWKVTFKSLNATELSEPVTATVLSAADTEELSNTVTYSVESYAKETRDDASAQADLVRLVNDMMKYGNSARNYFIQ